MRYRIWLANKLNDIKKKYREMATACLLKTRLAFVGEVQNYYQAAKQALSEAAIAGPEVNPILQQAQDQDSDALEDEQRRLDDNNEVSTANQK